MKPIPKEKRIKTVKNKIELEEHKNFIFGTKQADSEEKQDDYEYYIDGIKMPLEAFLRQLMISAGRFICVNELFKFRSDRVINGSKFERRKK